MSATIEWDVTDEVSESWIPNDQAEIDATFNEILAPMMSSGWICTLTIECGTFICACR